MLTFNSILDSHSKRVTLVGVHAGFSFNSILDSLVGVGVGWYDGDVAFNSILDSPGNRCFSTLPTSL